MIYSLNGQRCTGFPIACTELHQSGFYRSAYKAYCRAKRARPGDRSRTAFIAIVAKVMSYMAAAVERCRDAAGGRRVESLQPGNYVAPTLFINADNGMRVAREEIFGPVLTSIGFDTEDQALEIANDSHFGLAGYVWTSIRAVP